MQPQILRCHIYCRILKRNRAFFDHTSNVCIQWCSYKLMWMGKWSPYHDKSFVFQNACDVILLKPFFIQMQILCVTKISHKRHIYILFIFYFQRLVSGNLSEISFRYGLIRLDINNFFSSVRTIFRTIWI